MRSAEQAWTELQEPWRVCLQQAWEAYGAGAIPIGAVLVDGQGRIVVAARNRVFEEAPVTASATAPAPITAAKQISGSLIAHAEVNALVGLDPHGSYFDHVLYTSLEPCMMCVGASMRSRIGEIRYATADPHAGGGDRGLFARNASPDAHKLAIEGPRADEFGAFSATLILVYYLQHRATSDVLETFADATPTVMAAARTLAGRASIPRLAAEGAPVTAALLEFWDVLQHVDRMPGVERLFELE